MKISQFSDILEQVTPEGYNYRAQNRYAYNASKVIEPVFLFVPPRTWAIRWRDHCQHRETVTLMLGLPANIKQSGKEQYVNYSPIDARDDMIATAESIMATLNDNPLVRVVNSGIIASEFYDAPEGRQANNMVWLSWQAQVDLEGNVI